MNVRFALSTILAALVAMAGAFIVVADPIGQPSGPAPVVFVCRNGVAMSVWSAAYFNRLAQARGLSERAIARAAIPSYREVPANMAFALALDGFVLSGYRPEVITTGDVSESGLVVAIDTELPSGPWEAQIENWHGFPPMREQYFPSRRALEARVESLVERLDSAASADTSAVIR